MPLNLHLLRMLATVVRTGSFSRAADVLHVSQPAISKAEEEMRSLRGMRGSLRIGPAPPSLPT